MSLSSNEHPAHYIERVRNRSSYATARSIIRIMFWLAVIAVVLFSGIGAVAGVVAAFGDGPRAIVSALGLLVGAALYLVGVILLRAIAIAYFDAVDVLIDANREKARDA